MTNLYLVRHAHHDLLGRELVGRRLGVVLSRKGLEETERLGEALAPLHVTAVMSSPSERARQTADRIARRLGKDVTVAAAMDEVEFGEWTGRRFDELNDDRRWHRFNGSRARWAAPGGERVLDVQARVVPFLEGVAEQYPVATFVIVSHADVIRAALLHYLGMPLDYLQRIDLAPASISILSLTLDSCRVGGVNLTTEWLRARGAVC